MEGGKKGMEEQRGRKQRGEAEGEEERTGEEKRRGGEIKVGDRREKGKDGGMGCEGKENGWKDRDETIERKMEMREGK